jgi:hypothetical protein
MNINEMHKRLEDIKGMGLSIGDPKHGDFVLYVKVYERLAEFVTKLILHHIPFVVSEDGVVYRTVWVKEEHAQQLYSVNYGMFVDD